MSAKKSRSPFESSPLRPFAYIVIGTYGPWATVEAAEREAAEQIRALWAQLTPFAQGRLRATIQGLTQTNCWWAEHKAGEIITALLDETGEAQP